MTNNRIFRFFGVLCGLVFVSGVAHADQLGDITGKGLLQDMARTCSSKNFEKFHDWAMKTKFAEKSMKPFTVTKTETTLATENGYIVYDFKTKSVTVGKQTYSAQDPCDFALQLIQLKKKSAWLSLLLNEAVAKTDLVTEASSLDDKLLAGVGVVASGALVIGTSSVGVGLLGVGLVYLNSTNLQAAFEQGHAREVLSSVINDPAAKLFCDGSQITIQNANRKILVRSRDLVTGNRASAVDFKTGKTEVLDLSLAPASRHYLENLSDTCSSQEDAKRIEAALRNEETRSNIALLMSQGASVNFRRAAEGSSSR